MWYSNLKSWIQEEEGHNPNNGPMALLGSNCPSCPSKRKPIPQLSRSEIPESRTEEIYVHEDEGSGRFKSLHTTLRIFFDKPRFLAQLLPASPAAPWTATSHQICWVAPRSLLFFFLFWIAFPILSLAQSLVFLPLTPASRPSTVVDVGSCNLDRRPTREVPWYCALTPLMCCNKESHDKPCHTLGGVGEPVGLPFFFLLSFFRSSPILVPGRKGYVTSFVTRRAFHCDRVARATAYSGAVGQGGWSDHIRQHAFFPRGN
jgi:hypothetical protein